MNSIANEFFTRGVGPFEEWAEENAARIASDDPDQGSLLLDEREWRADLLRHERDPDKIHPWWAHTSSAVRDRWMELDK